MKKLTFDFFDIYNLKRWQDFLNSKERRQRFENSEQFAGENDLDLDGRLAEVYHADLDQFNQMTLPTE